MTRPDLQPWRYISRRRLLETRIFDLVEEEAVSPRTGQTGRFTVLETGDWVNVVPVTETGEVVLVRQWRHGSKGFTLEVPGGLVDPGEGPDQAAVREVLEETGHAGDRPVEIGVVEPNSAILDNLTFTYLIEGCRKVAELQLDAGEDIAVELHPLTDIRELVEQGTIRHALVISAFWWLALRRPDLLTL